MRENPLIHNNVLPRRPRRRGRNLLFPAFLILPTLLLIPAFLKRIGRIGVLFVGLSFLAACHNNKTLEIETIVIGDSIPEPTAEEVDSAAIEAARKAAIRAELEAKGLDRRIIVDKPRLKLFVVEAGDTIFRAGICCGAGRGDKTKKDDNKTPEGEFRISMIQNSTDWLWNPGDGRPLVPNCYGPWFLRLDTHWHSIGIHGTGSPRSIGRRSSHGCIRVTNDNIRKLKELVEVGTRVTVIADRLNGPLIAQDATKPGSEAPAPPKAAPDSTAVVPAAIPDSISARPAAPEPANTSEPARATESEETSSKETSVKEPEQVERKLVTDGKL